MPIDSSYTKLQDIEQTNTYLSDTMNNSISSHSSNSSAGTYTISVPSPIPPGTVFTSQPAYSNGTVFTTSFPHTGRQDKRKDVKDNGKIPIDIWATMYNNGVIDD